MPAPKYSHSISFINSSIQIRNPVLKGQQVFTSVIKRYFIYLLHIFLSSGVHQPFVQTQLSFPWCLCLDLLDIDQQYLLQLILQDSAEVYTSRFLLHQPLYRSHHHYSFGMMISFIWLLSFCKHLQYQKLFFNWLPLPPPQPPKMSFEKKKWSGPGSVLSVSIKSSLHLYHSVDR